MDVLRPFFDHTKEYILCLGTFNFIITLLSQTLIIKSFAISIRYECIAFALALLGVECCSLIVLPVIFW